MPELLLYICTRVFVSLALSLSSLFSFSSLLFCSPRRINGQHPCIPIEQNRIALCWAAAASYSQCHGGGYCSSLAGASAAVCGFVSTRRAIFFVTWPASSSIFDRLDRVDRVDSSRKRARNTDPRPSYSCANPLFLQTTPTYLPPQYDRFGRANTHIAGLKWVYDRPPLPRGHIIKMTGANVLRNAIRFDSIPLSARRIYRSYVATSVVESSPATQQ